MLYNFWVNFLLQIFKIDNLFTKIKGSAHAAKHYYTSLYYYIVCMIKE